MGSKTTFTTYCKRIVRNGVADRVGRYFFIPLWPKRCFAIVVFAKKDKK